MSSPFNISSILRTSTNITPTVEKEERKGSVAPSNIEQLAEFAIASVRQEGGNLSPRSSFTYTIPPGTQPTTQSIVNMTQSALIEANAHSPHLVKLAKTFKNVCEHGLVTQLRAQELNLNVSVSMDRNPNRSSISLNYIYSADGIINSLTDESKGGLSVALERSDRDGDLLFGSDLSDSNVLAELSERAHQTILVGMPVNINSKKQNDFGYTKLTLVTTAGDQNEIDKAVFLGIPGRDGSNEISTDDTIDPKNFGFILVPERLMPHIKNVQFHCPVFPVSSIKADVYFYGEKVKVLCPDYQTKLDELYKDGLLTHVVREKTQNEIN